jgi:hypothetical protein
MKFFICFFSFLFIINLTFADSFDSSLLPSFPSFGNLPPGPPPFCQGGAIDAGSVFFDCLSYFFSIILRILIAISLVLATISIVWAGILYITKGGEGKEGEIRKRIVYSVFGIIVALSAFFLVNLIDAYLNGMLGTYIIPFFGLTRIAYADQISAPTIPRSIKCGDNILPSALESTDLPEGIWQACLVYYLRSRFLPFLFGLSLVLGTIFLTWAGILYITQPSKTKEIHSRLKWGIIGIVISFLSLTIVGIISLIFS